MLLLEETNVSTNQHTGTPSLHTTPVGTLNPVSNPNKSTTITGIDLVHLNI